VTRGRAASQNKRTGGQHQAEGPAEEDQAHADKVEAQAARRRPPAVVRCPQYRREGQEPHDDSGHAPQKQAGELREHGRTVGHAPDRGKACPSYCGMASFIHRA
jgi:hypothetical protein